MKPSPEKVKKKIFSQLLENRIYGYSFHGLLSCNVLEIVHVLQKFSFQLNLHLILVMFLKLFIFELLC